jgi:hypothetical protein
MESLYQLLALLGAGLIAWITYRTVKSHPAVFSRDNITKSLSSLGVLAIILILFVTLLVFLVRSS